MNRLKSDAIRAFLLHPGWSLFSLAGVFIFFFVLNRGGVIVFFWTGGIFLLGHLVHGDYGLDTLSTHQRVLVGICASLVLMSLAFSYPQTDTHRLFRIGQMLIIVFCIEVISRTELLEHAYKLFGVVLTVSIVCQFLTRSLFALPYGTWSNPHYLANFAILTLPLVFYYFVTAPKPYNFIFLLLFAMDIEPVFRNASRPAFLALAVSTLFVITFLTRGRYRLIGLLAICASFFLVAVTNYAGFFDKLKELAASLPNEERVQIWKSSVMMLRDNSPAAWLVGNGIGSSLAVLPKYAIPDPLYQSFSFQHNFLLQVLFENGLIGTILVFGGLAFLLYILIRLSHRTKGFPRQLFINCITAVFLNCLIFTGLTVGVYSKYTLYPMGFIIGTVFVLAKEVRSDR
ncbi:MAG: O-antigen ligase family protein [Desulfobacterales bacterium]